MREQVVQNLRQSFSAYLDLVRGLPAGALEAKLVEASNTIGAQLWCVVGARESTTVAIERGSWPGFSCSLSSDDVKHADRIETAMVRTVEEFDAVIESLNWDPGREKLLLGMLEHETQHQGQLIRYLYALEYPFPPAWAKRWNL
ncbi:MAG: hypothetical protein OEM39_02700 [Acidimicrobiia bacterium]|nr:hypothetical protein [Acidimicrobiia bacterium]MDH3462902.1 hypothetical protein [Acidimicrobiia bacterium]